MWPATVIERVSVSFEHEVYQMHQAGRLDRDLISVFLPDGKIRTTEGPLWDYKVGFCHPMAMMEDEPALIAELLRDIAGMYNAFGGYLIIAYPDAQASIFRKLIKNDEFNDLTQRYLKARIPMGLLPTKTEFSGQT